jgi:single-stranded DNA-specific DHH superfamily exonuclease
MSTRLTNLNRLLPLVAIGTVADCQSIGEPTNRILVKAGLQILNQDKHGVLGLSNLLETTGLNQKIKQGYKLNSQDLGFTLSPILNSSGRISHARLSIATLLNSNADYGNYKTKLVLENSEYFERPAMDLAVELTQTNQDRKQMVKDILSEVENEAKSQYESGNKVLWLEGDWNKGIIGLLPVIVVSKSEEE